MGVLANKFSNSVRNKRIAARPCLGPAYETNDDCSKRVDDEVEHRIANAGFSALHVPAGYQEIDGELDYLPQHAQENCERDAKKTEKCRKHSLRQSIRLIQQEEQEEIDDD